MLESLKSSQLEYTKLSPEEMQKRGILGRLVGVCADFMAPTRNGRKYGQELWEKVFADPIMQERIENGVCFGELNHPFDGREETDIQKAAVCLAEVPKKGKDGKLRAIFDILSTPSGKILKTLCDYGSTLGVSSRGSGDLITDYDGNEAVDPSTYTCEGFDIVTIPAVKEARLQYVTESLDTHKKMSLTESLNKLMEDASEADRAIMSETLDNLGISLTEGTTADGVDYLELKNQAKAALKDTYGNITNNKDLENALKKAVEAHDNENIMVIAKLLKKFDPDFVKEHSKVNDLAAKPVKDQTANQDGIDFDNVPLPEDPIPPTEENALTDGDMAVTDAATGLESEEDSLNATEPEIKEALDNNEKNIVYNNSEENQQQQPKENVADDIQEEPIKEEVDTNKSDIISTLQEALLSKQLMETEILKLNEKLSVCYAKEAKQDELISQLRESLKIEKQNQSTTSTVTESLKVKTSKQVAMLNEANGQIRNLNEKCQTIVEKYNTLAENYNQKSKEIKNLNEKLDEYSQSVNKLKAENESLSETLKTAKEESQHLTESYSEKLEKSNTLVEKYKAVANKAINKYIDSQALKLDITSNEIKNRLPANYSFNDIDSICESLSAVKVSMNMLPFRNPAKLRENMKLEIKGQKEPILPKEQYNVDDEVDDSLKTLAGM